MSTNVELQDSLRLGGANEIVWGAGERISRYAITNTSTLLFLPDQRTLNLTDVFAQDSDCAHPLAQADSRTQARERSVVRNDPAPRCAALLEDHRQGAPLVRGLARHPLRPRPSTATWLSTWPARCSSSADRTSDPRSSPPTSWAFVNSRARALSFSLSTYYNVIRRPAQHRDHARHIATASVGQRYARRHLRYRAVGQLSGHRKLAARVRLRPNKREHLRFKPWSSGLLGVSQAGDDPDHQASLRSSLNITADLNLEADLRYVGSLPDPAVSAYTELNVRLGWRMNRHCDVAVSGFNLLHGRHEEFTVPPADAISRSILVSATLRL